MEIFFFFLGLYSFLTVIGWIFRVKNPFEFAMIAMFVMMGVAFATFIGFLVATLL